MLDKFIQFFVHNVIPIIEVVFLVTIPLTIYIVYRSFKQEKDQLDMSVDQMKGLEEILKKHLGNLPPPTVTVSSVGVSAEGASNDMANLVKEKESMIGSLNEKIGQLEKAMQNNPGVDNKEWEKKIADLKDRLAEYEIIEDDIANLTFYKSENIRLKEELSKLGGNISAPAAAPVPAPPAPSATIESLISSAETVAAAPASPAPVSSPSAQNVISFPQAPPTAPPATKNVMEEFEAAVRQKNALETATSIIDNKKVSKLAVDEDDDTHSKKPEFSMSAVPKQGDLLSEFNAAVEDVPVAPAQNEATPGFQATNVNSEKLLAEIGQMATEPAPATPEPAEGDDSKKLINEFEAFVKGSN